ncbi:MAG TPA: M48 family metallopeptidase [Longimicrobiaceae bacterium]|nr:M48 family metallopeptidase [Longimicrobiaceae bacterium]
MRTGFASTARRTVAVLSLASVAACASASSVTVQQEQALGADYSRQINAELPILRDAASNDFINDMGRRIARVADPRGIPYTFYIVNSDVVNAFAVPGGYVYVNRGLVERAGTANELAGVLAHEIGHVVERHSIQQMAKAQNANNLVGVLGTVLLGRASPTVQQGAGVLVQGVGTAVFAGYSRNDERQADHDGVIFSTRAGYNPQGMVTMFQRLLSENSSRPGTLTQYFSTHPLTQERIANVQAQINATPEARASTLRTDTREFQAFRARVRTITPIPSDRK